MSKQKYPKYLKPEMKFGRLTVIEVDENSKIKDDGTKQSPSNWFYWCECNSCHNIFTISKSNILRRNQNTKCKECLRIYPKYLESGMKFGRLVIIREAKELNHNKQPWGYQYECQCKCGGISYPTKNALCTGRTQSCGCLSIDHNKEYYSKVNLIENCGEYIKIFFFNTDTFTKIDSDDYEKVKDICWTLGSNGYVYGRLRGYKNKQVLLHNFLMNPPKGMEIDHLFGDTLDNRQKMLRIVTSSQNNMNKGEQSNNSSGHRGVHYHKQAQKWWAYINKEGHRYDLGLFESFEEAVTTRKEAEIKFFGEFRYKLND